MTAMAMRLRLDSLPPGGGMAMAMNAEKVVVDLAHGQDARIARILGGNFTRVMGEVWG